MIFRSAPFLLLWLFSQAAASDSEVAEYGQKCSSTIHCNHESYLLCSAGNCICQNGAHYDSETKKCTAQIGGACKIFDYVHNSSFEIACPANAECSKHHSNIALPKSMQKAYMTEYYMHKCYCANGFAFDKVKRTCKPVLAYGKTCGEKTAECNPGAGLICSEEKTCACHEKDIYDKKMSRCAHPLGAKCKPMEQCEEGSICSNQVGIYTMSYYDSATVKSHVRYDNKAQNWNREGVCVCAPGSTQNSKGKCVNSFGSSCSENSPCNAEGFLACVDGLCQCERGTSDIFDSSNGGSCRIQIGNACSEKKGPGCIGNATCEDGHCTMECGKGSSGTPMGTCLQGHGSSCDVNTGKYCNSFEGLACINEECACFDSSLKWDKKDSICVAKEDGRCGKIRIFEGTLSSISNTEPFHKTGLTGVDHYVVGCAEGHSCEHEEHNLSDMKFCVKH